ncbi:MULTISPECIES: DUF4397 domain-containing protein [unclassified Haladaptatus]|uniref:DUF4397 domain-containing protein n=1 Tax=unclassified Haladaptatus TaxID=2622732 RepID=UPI00209C21D6|nr:MULTISPECIES: DUF4397 domain-containing protein [unclassified Haladaptatus]MCO8244085.1 DUF4397 domain-containing protein [Haladaptatus sp. AB643]MCO8255891.1 DUF4397 domain-containing protein [Haladaptatus sp. AB618]
MRDTTRTLGVTLVAALLAVSAGFAGIGAMASGGGTTTSQTTMGNGTTYATPTTNTTTAMGGTATAAPTSTTTANETMTTAANQTTSRTTANQTTATSRTTTSNGTGNAQVRVAHMSPDAPPVDVLVDNETAVSNLSYGNVSDYTSLPAGEHNVTITAAGDPSTVVSSDNVTFDAGTNYTVAATGLLSGSGDNAFEPVVYEDNFTAPGQGNASVRLVHEAIGAGPVDVTVKGTNTTLFDNVSFRNATAYKEVPAGNYTLEVRPATANDDGTVLKTFNVTLNESTAYSAFAAGYVDHDLVPQGTPDRPFDLILVTDFTAAGNVTTTPTTATATTTATTTTATTATSTTPQTTSSTGTMTTTPETTSMNTTSTTPPTNTTTASTTTSQTTTMAENTTTTTTTTTTSK